MKSCVGKIESPKINRFFSAPQSSNSAKNISAAEKSEVVDVISNMCANDIHPFSIVDGPGFRKLAQKLISIGAKHGNISVDDVLPSA